MYSCVDANVHHTGLQIKKPSYLFPLLGGKQFTPAFPLGPFRFPLLLFCPAAFTFDSSQFIGPKVKKLLQSFGNNHRVHRAVETTVHSSFELLEEKHQLRKFQVTEIIRDNLNNRIDNPCELFLALNPAKAHEVR